MPPPKMRPGQTSFILSLLLLQHSYNVTASGIQFTTPPGGGTFPAGNFTARWEDAGGSPPLMSDLTVYMLDLIVGGNTPADSRPVQSLSTGSVQQGSANCNISSDVAQSIQNGFYLRMTSNTTDGNSIINYSSRFTVIQMTGSTDPQYIQGASAAVGDANVPSSQYILHSSPAPSPSAPSPTPSDNPNSADNDDKHVSLAAIVGVTISISVICTALLIAAGWYLRKRKRKEKEVVQRKSMPPHALGSKAELAADSGSTSPDLELNNRTPVEVDTFGKAEELEGSTVYYELESDWNGWEMSARRSQVQPYDPTR